VPIVLSHETNYFFPMLLGLQISAQIVTNFFADQMGKIFWQPIITVSKNELIKYIR
jgi:hypothetical protein